MIINQTNKTFSVNQYMLFCVCVCVSFVVCSATVFSLEIYSAFNTVILRSSVDTMFVDGVVFGLLSKRIVVTTG